MASRPQVGTGWYYGTMPGAGGGVPAGRCAASDLAGAVPQQLHLDLTVPTSAELDVQHERALTLGARLLSDRTDDRRAPADSMPTAGHPFAFRGRLDRRLNYRESRWSRRSRRLTVENPFICPALNVAITPTWYDPAHLPPPNPRWRTYGKTGRAMAQFLAASGDINNIIQVSPLTGGLRGLGREGKVAVGSSAARFSCLGIALGAPQSSGSARPPADSFAAEQGKGLIIAG